MDQVKKRVAFKGEMVDAVEVEFEVKDEPWAEYKLSDGATIRVRSIITKVVRILDKFDDEGNPIYAINSQNIATIKDLPEELRKRK